LKFKELEVFGFKSFADKLDVKFGEGITAIVGPNGCGKSNVADAIRWVLGEQSAKLLRGKNMMDVIFSGTEKRKSLSFCEVLLHFDNTGRLFPSLDYNEVIISRKLYRSGESSYFINGNNCKLRDIADLLHDGGMGREGYSIIGQGRIDELLSAKPENRRAIFEEAAGISKYKARKAESERKLVRTRENLVRIDDILAEKGRTLEPLTLQSEKARKCLDLRDKLRHHEINTYIYQRETSQEAKDQIATRLAATSEEHDLREKEFDGLLREYRGTRDNYESSDANMAALHEELTLLNVGLEKQAGEISNLRQRKEFLSENNRALSEQISVLEKEIAAADLALSKLGCEEGDCLKRLYVLRQDYDKTDTAYLTAIDTLTERTGRAEEERRAELDAMDKLAEIKSNMAGLKAERQMLSERVGSLQELLTENIGKAKAAQALLEEMGGEVDGLITQKNEETEELYKQGARQDELSKKIAELSDKLSKYDRDFYSASARFKLLRDMKESYDGFGAGVKNLLTAAKTNKELSRRIEGTLAELIRVEPRLEIAMEIALAAGYQNIVVRTEDDANYLVDYLKQNRLGRVTFMPVSTAKPRDIDGRYAALLKTKGCLGRASDLVGFDSKYKNVVESYLGGTVIAENKDAATRMAQQSGFAFKIVTLEGEVYATNGSITGGSLKADRSVANIFTHERELRELEPQLSNLKRNMDDAVSLHTKTAADFDKVQKRVKTTEQNLHALELVIAAKMESLTQISAECDAAELSKNELTRQVKQDGDRLKGIDDDLGSVVKLEEFLANARKTAGEQGQEAAQFIDKLRSEADELRNKLAALNLEINTLENALKYAQTNTAREKAEKEELLIKLNSTNLLTDKNREQIETIENALIELSKKSGEKDTERIKQIRANIAGIDESKKAMATRIAEIDLSREQLTNRLQLLRDKKTEYAFQLQSVDSDIEAKEQRIYEDYNLDHDQCLPFREDEYDINKGIAETGRLKRAIINLGDVNIGAIEQCKEAYSEYQKYAADREDLVKAEGDLIKIIKNLSADMLRLFNDSFVKIRANFVRIFKELFDGGSADLYLTEDESGDPLLAGIEIEAQPPQKKLQSISLLSGGERALTAIAILFAILRLKPMPFCVLDEIEAALDDANAGRFAKYLRRFSEETQFIVITHRKPTMELSDSLYGVTMEEKGVSKIVSVKLSDAVRVAEESVAV